MAKGATLAELVADVAARDGAKPALIFQDQPISYAQLNGLIERCANALAARGIARGDRVAIMLPNIPQFVVAYYAVARLGAIVVPLNVLYKADEIAYMLGDSEAKAFIVFEGFWAQGAEAVKGSPAVEHTVVVGQGAAPEGTTPWSALVDGSAPPRPAVDVKLEDTAVICYTSGTTGRSKGALLTHRNFIANCEQFGAMRGFEFDEHDIALLVLPLFHIYAMNVGLNAAMRLGSTAVLMIRFEPLPALEAIQKHRVTIFLGAPPMFIAWVNTPGIEGYDLSSLRIVNSGAAALPMQVLQRFKELTGIEIQEGYGLTETAPVTHSNSAAPRVKPGTIGMPIPGVEARVVDENDQDVAPGQEGEIVVRGENITPGYWRQPEATAEALRGGWRQ